jgi:hypothetical protein
MVDSPMVEQRQEIQSNDRNLANADEITEYQLIPDANLLHP